MNIKYKKLWSLVLTMLAAASYTPFVLVSLKVAR